MYIKNVEAVSIPMFQCGRYLADYFMRNGIPLLSQKNETFFFSDSEKLRLVLNNAPLFTKFIDHMGLNF